MPEAPQREAQQLPQHAPQQDAQTAQQLDPYSKQVTLTHSQIRLIASTLHDREHHWYEKADKADTPGRKVYCELLQADVRNLRHQLEELIR